MPRVSPEITTPWATDWTSLIVGHRGAIAGRSGSGKSNFVKYVYNCIDPKAALCVYISKHKEFVPNAHVVDSVQGLVAAARAGHRKIQLRLPKLEDEGGVERVRAVLLELWRWVETTGENASRGGRPVDPWIVVFFDEAHRYAPLNGPYGPVEAFLAEGRKFGAGTVVISQRPQRVTGEAWEQPHWVVIFRCKITGAKYLHGKGIPYMEFRSEVEKDYHWVMVDDENWTPYGAVPNMD